jgi:hypothetical protein
MKRSQRTNKEAVKTRVRITPFTWNGDALIERNAIPRPAESELTQEPERPLSGETRISRVGVEIAADDGGDSRAPSRASPWRRHAPATAAQLPRA